jgi:hypothetical protein
MPSCRKKDEGTFPFFKGGENPGEYLIGGKND